MQLEKTVAVRMTSEDQNSLKNMADSKRMKFGSYVRYVLANHINEENEK